MINDPHDINGLDPEDIGLKSIMGVHFVDETKGERSPEPKEAPKEVPKKPKSTIVEPTDWRPPMPKKDIFDKLKEGAKWCFICGGIEWLVFYWQTAGLMDASVATPTMLVCMALAGFGVGKAFGGKA